MKRLLFLSKIIIVGILLFLFVDGINKMFFHQDDIILLWDVVTNFPRSMWETASGHLILFFKPFYFLEWSLFHLHFTYYLAVSIILHTLVIFTAGKIVFKLTKDKYWRMITLLMLVVNANFYEVLWMSSSQMMSLSTLFALLSLLVTLNLIEKPKIGIKDFLLLTVLAIIPGLNWGTGLLIPLYLLIAFGWQKSKGRLKLTKVAFPLILSQITLAAIFLLSPRSIIEGGLTSHPFRLMDVVEMLKFVFFGISYSIVGRYLFPLASRVFRFLAVFIFFSWLAFPKRLNSLKKIVISNSRIVLLGLTVLFGSYFLISMSRFQFGLSQAGAPRYAYMPMMFLVIAIVSSLAKIGLSLEQKKFFLVIVMLYALLSLGAFTQVTVKWTERPQKNRVLFSYLQTLPKGECLKDDFLPWYIVEVDKWTLKDIWPIFNKDFDPFTGGKNCIQINRDIPTPWSPVLK